MVTTGFLLKQSHRSDIYGGQPVAGGQNLSSILKGQTPPLQSRWGKLIVTMMTTEEHMDASMQRDQHSTRRNISSEVLLVKSSSKRNGAQFIQLSKRFAFIRCFELARVVVMQQRYSQCHELGLWTQTGRFKSQIYLSPAVFTKHVTQPSASPLPPL